MWRCAECQATSTTCKGMPSSCRAVFIIPKMVASRHITGCISQSANFLPAQALPARPCFLRQRVTANGGTQPSYPFTCGLPSSFPFRTPSKSLSASLRRKMQLQSQACGGHFSCVPHKQASHIPVPATPSWHALLPALLTKSVPWADKLPFLPRAP